MSSTQLANIGLPPEKLSHGALNIFYCLNYLERELIPGQFNHYIDQALGCQVLAAGNMFQTLDIKTKCFVGENPILPLE